MPKRPVDLSDNPMLSGLCGQIITCREKIRDLEEVREEVKTQLDEELRGREEFLGEGGGSREGEGMRNLDWKSVYGIVGPYRIDRREGAKHLNRERLMTFLEARGISKDLLQEAEEFASVRGEGYWLVDVL